MLCRKVSLFFLFFFFIQENNNKKHSKTKLSQKHSKEKKKKTFIISRSLVMLTVESPALFNQVYSISGYNADPVHSVCCVLYFLHMHQCTWALAKLQKHSIKDNQKRADQGGIWKLLLCHWKLEKKKTNSYKKCASLFENKIYIVPYFPYISISLCLSLVWNPLIDFYVSMFAVYKMAL